MVLGIGEKREMRTVWAVKDKNIVMHCVTAYPHGKPGREQMEFLEVKLYRENQWVDDKVTNKEGHKGRAFEVDDHSFVEYLFVPYDFSFDLV